MISNPSSGDVNAHRRQGSARVHDSAGNKICSHNDQRSSWTASTGFMCIKLFTMSVNSASDSS